MFIKEEESNISTLIHGMLESYNRTQDSMHEIDEIAKQSKQLAVTTVGEIKKAHNSDDFMLIAQGIRSFSDSNKKANERNKQNVEQLNEKMNRMIGVRTADVALDLIDKIDRNLFERNCDVQAWAAFEAIRTFATTPSFENKEAALQLLKDLHRIYEVYHDIFLADQNGIVIAAAKRMEHIGKDVNQEEWFLGAKSQDDGAYVTDLHFSGLINDYVVSYSCKVRDAHNNFVGVLTTRFHWKYILEMIDETKIGLNGEIYLINKDGQVIGARDRDLIFNKNMLLECQGAQAILADDSSKLYGCATEKNSKNQLTRVLGYAKTKGYNSYKGQGWAVLALENM